MTCIIVLGCFRSGTSAVAGTLHHLGIFMGENFDEPNKNNPKGFFEDIEFKRLHESYEEGLDHIDPFYKNLVEKRIENHDLWGVKDPLLCKYLDKLTTFTSDHKLIVCRRSVAEIAASMGKSIGIPDERMFLPLAQDYVSRMNDSLSRYQGPILELEKRDSMKHILEPICQFVGVTETEAAREFLS